MYSLGEIKTTPFLKVSKCGCILLILYYLWYVEAFGNNILFSNGGFLLVTAGLFFHLLTKKIFKISDLPKGILVNFIMVGYCLVTGVFVSYNLRILLLYTRNYLIYSIIVFAMCYISTIEKSIQWIINIITISALVCSIHTIFFGYQYSSNRIVLSSNSNPNLLGLILVLGIFSIVYKMRYRIFEIIVSFGVILIIYYSVIMTGSRKSFIAATILIVMWIWNVIREFKNSGNGHKLLICIVFLSAILVIYGSRLWGFLTDTAVFDRLQTMGEEDSNRTRIELYGMAWKLFLLKPLFGGGLHQFGYWSGAGGYSHSTYAEAISCFGLIGSLIYFNPIICAIKRLLKNIFEFKSTYTNTMVFVYCCVELFNGAGSIFFYDMHHFIAWTLIYLLIDYEKWNDEGYDEKNRKATYAVKVNYSAGNKKVD